MKTRLQNTLYQEFPTIFRQKDLPMTETCMCWGFECGDGWYNLIYRLCEQIESHQSQNTDCTRVEATQVKEKYGSLRFYHLGGDKFVDELVNNVEEASTQVCEVCGQPGELIGGSWLKTLCKGCNDRR